MEQKYTIRTEKAGVFCGCRSGSAQCRFRAHRPRRGAAVAVAIIENAQREEAEAALRRAENEQ